MGEAEGVGVEGLAIDQDMIGFGGMGAEEVGEGDFVAAGVGFVGEDGVADVGEVDADLVGAAGLGLAADESEAAESFEDLVEGDGFLAAFRDGADGHFFAVGGVEADAAFDVVGVSLGSAGDEGEVFLVDGALFELEGEVAVGLVVFGDQEEARGVAVQAVDDTGAVFAGDGGEGVVAKLEGVDQGAGPVALGGVDDHAGGFVDDGEGFVFVDDFEGDVFGDWGVVGELGEPDADDVVELDFVGGFDEEAVDLEGVGVDDFSHDASGIVGVAAGEVSVDSLTDHARLDREFRRGG